MAVSDVPSKVIERTGAVIEKSLDIAKELTILKYTKGVSEEDILTTYTRLATYIIDDLVPKTVINESPVFSLKWTFKNKIFLLGTLFFLLTAVVFFINKGTNGQLSQMVMNYINPFGAP